MSNSIFGELQFAGNDMAWPGIKFDRLGLNKYQGLLFASVLGDAGIIKGIRALLNCDKRATIKGSGALLRRASFANESMRPDGIIKLEGGYTTLVHRMAYGMTHAVFITRSPGFLAALTDDHLWHKLTQTEFTTPLLREWVPFIRQRLTHKGLLREAYAYRCECASLDATTADLDAIVTEGLEDGDIIIPTSSAPALRVVG